MGSIRDVMTANPTACQPSTTVADAAKVMANEDVGPVPIVQEGRIVGIVTDRDLVVRVLAEGRDPHSTTVGDIASSDLVTVTPETELSAALSLMAQNQVRRLPVVEGEQLVGIVAQADVARAADEEKTGEVVQDISQ
ncbi:MAG: CBS domain-containing protein [Thermoleophilia bacterium]|jgi:CBS domain-containing protein|nr:CBS domain-containing protein [Thermoleophilia bacterium]